MRGYSRKGGERGRERKSKSAKKKNGREEDHLTTQELAQKWEPEVGRSGKKGKKNRNKWRDENEEPAEFNAHNRLNAELYNNSGRAGRKGRGAAVNLTSLSEEMFMNWEELLDAREGLKQKMDKIAAVHGWEGKVHKKAFLGGVEPASFLHSIRADMTALEPTVSVIEGATRRPQSLSYAYTLN